MTDSLITLNKMRIGQRGKVCRIDGGNELITRLDSLGIHPGREISKVSSTPMRGPTTIQVGHAKVAIGFGMARKIMVEVTPSQP